MYLICLIKDFYDVVILNDDIVFFNKDSGNVTFSSNEMGILSVNPNNFKPDDDNFNEVDPETLIQIIAWCNKYKRSKVGKKDTSNESWHACSMAPYQMVGLMYAIR